MTAPEDAITMVELVARAIAGVRNANQGDDDWGVLPADYERARAALEAMREPTDEMWNAGYDTAEGGGISDNGGIEGYYFKDGIESMWRAMVDAALSQPNHQKGET